MRPSPFRRDEVAAVDVPFRMLLSVVLVSMASAVLYPALQAYQEKEMEDRVSLVLAEIDAAALAVHRHPGSSRTVAVDVPSSGGIRLVALTVGGDLDGTPAEVGTIGWQLSSGASGHHLVSSNTGPVPMAGPGGEALVVERMPCLLVLTAASAPTGARYGTFVMVSLA